MGDLTREFPAPVFRAVRADDQYQKQVAPKVATEDGLPWLAMDFVEGPRHPERVAGRA